MGDEVWFPPGDAAIWSGEEELPPDATMLMGDEVLQEGRASVAVGCFNLKLMPMYSVNNCPDIYFSVLKYFENEKMSFRIQRKAVCPWLNIFLHSVSASAETLLKVLICGEHWTHGQSGHFRQ